MHALAAGLQVCSSTIKREQRATYFSFWHAVYAEREEVVRAAQERARFKAKQLAREAAAAAHAGLH